MVTKLGLGQRFEAPPALIPAKIIKETLSKNNLSNLSSLEPSWEARILKISVSPDTDVSLLKL